MTYVLDQRSNSIVETVDIGFSRESRVPEVNDGMNSLLRTLDNQSNEKQEEITGYDIKVSVIRCDFIRVFINVAKVPESYL
ncbi:hypothetical protein N7523_000713 [Penicillium sp. IBT 18751x]|nr:hypothetical protein N7523_000713 [Penicillium sp. IBT 18751x]